MKALKYIAGGATLKLDDQRCTGCGMCIQVCPHHVFELNKGKAMIVHKELCMECGACSKNCRFGALYVRSGVGCAAGILNGILRNTEPSCDCSSSSTNICCKN